MTETKATVSYSRKTNVRPYETADASFFIELDITGLTMDQIIDAARGAFTSVKGVVLEQLGLDMELDASGVLVEKISDTAKITAAFPGAQEVPALAGGFVGLPESRPSHIKEAVWTALNTLGAKAFFDNRPAKAEGKYKPTAADFKAKTGYDFGSVWLTKKAS